MKAKIIAPDQVPGLIRDGSTVSISGAWMLVPDRLLRAIGESFEASGHPRDLTATFLLCPGGTEDQPGIEHLARQGLLRKVIGGSFPNIPKARLRSLIAESRVEAYNLPAGMVASWYRETGAARAGALSKRGIGTFVDPRVEGGGMNGASKSSPLSVVNIGPDEYLFWPAGSVDVSLIRASTADESGNLTMEREPATLTAFAQAMAARAGGGIVIAQVRNVVPAGQLSPHLVKVPGMLVDYLVVEPDPLQAGGIRYDPSLCGESTASLSPGDVGSGADRRIAERALREIRPGDVVVLGYGLSAMVPHIMLQQGAFDTATFAIEQGSIGGLPLQGFGFGSSINPGAIFDANSQFDLFQGASFDQAMLSFLQVDQAGRVNVHRLDANPYLSAGVGGFIDIAASAPRLLFLGYFTAGGLKVEAGSSSVRILQEGRMKKFVRQVDHITFDPAHAEAREILYITERAVFRRQNGRLALIEMPPGIDLQRDVMGQMEFEPDVHEKVRKQAGAK